MSAQFAKVGDVARLASGFAFDSDHFNSTRGIPLIRIRDVGKNFTETYYDGAYANEHLVTKGDILIAMDGEFRIAEWVGQDALLNQRVCKVVPNGKVDRKYLLYYLPFELKKIEDKTSFATVKHISLNQIREIELSLPPLPIQQKIAAILDTANNLRQKDKQLLTLYDNLAQSVFYEMFGDQKMNKTNWTQVATSEVCDVQGGLQLSGKRASLPETVPYLRVANVLRNKLDLSEIKTFAATSEEIERTRLLPNDLLIVEGHGNRKEIGRAALWDGSITTVSHQNHIIRARPRKNLVDPIYLLAFWNSKFGLSQLYSASNTTSGLNTISTGVVKNIMINLPPMELQKRFGKMISEINTQKKKAEVTCRYSEDLFQTLLQKAFNGQLVEEA